MRNKPADIKYGGLDAERIRNAKPQFHKEHLEMFVYMVKERYRMHLLKDVEKRERPWTKDPILSSYRFTNVRREHDRTTKHLLHTLDKHKSSKYSNKIMNIVLFRLFNKIETSELIGWIDWGKYDEQSVRNKLLSAPKDYVYFTNAFLMSGMKRMMNLRYPEEEFKPMNIPRALDEDKHWLARDIKRAKHPSDVIATLKKVRGIHDFLAYQIFVDLTYLDEFPWSENEFTVSGPGCEQGLDELFESKDGLSYDELLFWLRDNCPFTQDELDELMIDLPPHDRVMNIMSLENCMCELSKYIRAVEGTGRPRNKYKEVQK